MSEPVTFRKIADSIFCLIKFKLSTMNLEQNPSLSAQRAAKLVTETSGMEQGKGLFTQPNQETRGQASICLPKGRENEFFIITGVEIACMLMKRAGKLMTAREERWNMCIEQTYMKHTSHVHSGWRQHQNEAAFSP